MPKRIQRKRTKGWRMPEGAIYVGRPSRWGNPIRATGEWIEAACHAYGYPAARAWRPAMAVALYRWWMDGVPVTPLPHRLGGARWIDPLAAIEMTAGSSGGAFWLPAHGVLHLPRRPDLLPLRGRDLVCWCDPDDPLQPCHADVLLELANR